MANKDFSEDLFQAMEQIINAKLAEVKFDKTILCTITDNSNASTGQYQVTDGSVTFEAYSENTEYSKDSQVYVLIPQGDWNNRKQITSLYSINSKSIPYISELEKILVVEDMYSEITEIGNNGQIKNEEDEEVIGTEFIVRDCIESEYWDGTEILYNGYSTNLINKIYLTFNIQTIIKQEYNIFNDQYEEVIISGKELEEYLKNYQFGIQLTVKDNDNELIFLYKDTEMLGNPLYFLTPVKQEVTYSISSKMIPNIRTVEVKLLSEVNHEDISPLDILVSDIQVVLGHDVNSYTNNTVKILPFSSCSTYDLSLFGDGEYATDRDRAEMKLQLLWVNKDDEGRYVGFTDSDIITPNIEKATDKAKLELTTLIDGEEVPGPDANKIYYWIDWHRDTDTDSLRYESSYRESSSPFLHEKYYLPLLSNFANTRVYAIVWVNGEAYQSDTLTFKNMDPVTLPEETIKRLNLGYLNTQGLKPTDEGTQAGHARKGFFPQHPNGDFIKFSPEKQVEVVTTCFPPKFSEDVLQESLALCWKIAYSYQGATGAEEVGETVFEWSTDDENSVVNFEFLPYGDDNIDGLKIIVTLPTEEELEEKLIELGISQEDITDEEFYLSHVSAIGLIYANANSKDDAIISEDILLKRVKEAEAALARIQNKMFLIS